MKIKYLFLLMISMTLSLLTMGQNYTISGTVIDKNSGETLIGVVVQDSLSGKGTVTNAYGRFSLTLPAGAVALKIHYVCYASYSESFHLVANREMNVALDNDIMLKEVMVQAERISGRKSSQISALEIPVERIKEVPVIFGETDILKVLQLLPGVQSGNEGSAGFYVRGGGPDENLFLLDGIPLYNVNHMGGFFSAFNSDAVKSVTLYKGSFPARFSGRLSSVLDVTANNGNDKKIHGDIGVGLVSAHLSLEGPIVKEKTTFSLSARRTYLDLLMQPVLMAMASSWSMDNVNGGYYFYDINAKVTHKFSNKSRLYASYYMGSDKVYARVKYNDEENAADYDKRYLKLGYDWGNIVGSLRWNYQLTPKLFMNLTGAYTRYHNYIDLIFNGENQTGGNYSSFDDAMTYKSGIQDLSAMLDFDYAPMPNHNVKFGGSIIHHIFSPEVVYQYREEGYNDTSYVKFDTKEGGRDLHADEFNAYIEDDWIVCRAVKLNVGVHLSAFSVEDTIYPSIQPRFSGRIVLTDNLSFKAGYAYMTQYMHLLSNSNISMPTDLWVPVTQKIQPMGAHQVAAGFFYRWHDLVDFSAEAYYKRMNNLLEYKDGASFFNASMSWEDKVVMGEGKAYGVEFLAQKNVGRWTGWIGYTLSKTTRLFDREDMELNNGNEFPAKYDRRHDISIVAMYKPSERFDISATWVFSSGNVATLALQEYEGTPNTADSRQDISRVDGYPANNTTAFVESRNNYRLPAYHRMDIGMNFHKQKKHGMRTINVSIYNVYNHRNPFIIYTSNSYSSTDVQGNHYGRALVQASLFPIIPSVSYSFKF